mgnify:CR=1 FL=1
MNSEEVRVKSEKVMKIFAKAKINQTYSLFTITFYFNNIRGNFEN